MRAWKVRIGRAAADLRFAWYSARLMPERAAFQVRARLARGRYRVLDERALRARRRSETVFVFGSGYSINDLTPPEIERFEAADTLGFNWFVHQRLLRMDYHLIREIPENDADPAIWRPQLARFFELVRENPYYRETVFLVQDGLRALNSNRALALGLLPARNPVFLWRTEPGRLRLGRSFAEGLSHPHATLEECINFAVLAGWREIVLVGIDLYDRRYFWLGSEETRSTDAGRGASFRDRHARGSTGMIENLGRWRAELEDEGVRLWVYNPRSLLAEVLPVYEPHSPA